jgi:hypothetical protein
MRAVSYHLRYLFTRTTLKQIVHIAWCEAQLLHDKYILDGESQAQNINLFIFVIVVVCRQQRRGRREGGFDRHRF